MKIRGIIIFYINVNPEHRDIVKPQELIDLTRENHVENISNLKSEGWDVMFVPCVGEASRCEKVDLITDWSPDDD